MMIRSASTVRTGIRNRQKAGLSTQDVESGPTIHVRVLTVTTMKLSILALTVCNFFNVQYNKHYRKN